MSWRLLVFLGFGIALLVVFKVARSQPSFPGETTWDFGNVQPGNSLVARFSVTNHESALAVYGGFERACGVKPAFSSNGVLQANESGELTLTARATRRRGPGGASFVLTETLRGRVKERTYRLTWNVVGGPWLDVSELWFNPSEDLPLVRLMNASSEAVITVVEAPRGLHASVIRDTISLRPVRESSVPEPSGALTITVLDRGELSRFRIPVYTCDKGGPRIHPTLSRMTTSGAKGEIPVGRVVGGMPEGWSVTCDRQMGRIRVLPDGQILLIPPRTGPKLTAGLHWVHLVNLNGQVRSSALISLVEASP